MIISSEELEGVYIRLKASKSDIEDADAAKEEVEAENKELRDNIKVNCVDLPGVNSYTARLV